VNDRAIVITGPGEIGIGPVPPGGGPVGVQVRYSGVSAGTELAFLTGAHPALHSSFDTEFGLFRPGADGAYPVQRLGYMEVGTVTTTTELGPPLGATVALTCGHRTATGVDPRTDRLVVLPDDLDPVLGVYVAHMGPICANGLLHAAAEECGTDVRALEEVLLRVARLAEEVRLAEEAARLAAEQAARAAESVTAAASGGVQMVVGRVTSGFGARWGTSHQGLDVAAPIGTPIRVPLDGTVTDSGPASGFGQWVRVRHDDGTVTVYGHISRSHVSVGQSVSAGEVIADVGNEGRSTGPHLHFEVVTPGGTKINPRPWLDERGIGLT